MAQRLQTEVRTWLYLVRVFHKLEKRLTAQLEQHHLTLAQFDVLAQLQRNPHCMQQELANRLLVTKGNIVGILNRMEQAGLVKRQAHPDDGRAHTVCLTAQAANLADVVIPAHEALIAEYLGLLPEEDRQQLHTSLRRLNQALGNE